MMFMRNACLEDNAARITCPKCGRDLGPVQPLPSTEVRCLVCKRWVKAWKPEMEDDPGYAQKEKIA